ncbi:hypothetical protein BDD12DRAFT_895367 [Trichophaea hybrida]|nr:hypothetical protein BDD12DRAFT_895367 [Trichophaea hybrida]
MSHYLRENDPRAILESARFERHRQIVAINVSFNNLLSRFPPPADWREKYALLERALHQEKQVIGEEEAEAPQPPPPQPPSRKTTLQNPHIAPKRLRTTRSSSFMNTANIATRAARRRSENLASTSADVSRKLKITCRRNFPRELLLQLNHYPELQRRLQRHPQRRKEPERRSTGDMVDWLILICAKEGRRRRAWDVAKKNMCLDRNVKRGRREKWRGGVSDRDT